MRGPARRARDSPSRAVRGSDQCVQICESWKLECPYDVRLLAFFSARTCVFVGCGLGLSLLLVLGLVLFRRLALEAVLIGALISALVIGLRLRLVC